MFYRPAFSLLAVCLVACGSCFAQDEEKKEADSTPHSIRVTPESLTLNVGESKDLSAEVLDAGGRPVEATVFYFSRNRRELSVSPTGKVTARKSGQFTVIVREVSRKEGRGQTEVKVTVPFPKPDKIAIDFEKPAFVGTTVKLPIQIFDKSGEERTDLTPKITFSDSSLVQLDEFGFLTALKAGKLTITAEAEGLSVSKDIEVKENPVAKIELVAAETSVRTGDVVQFDTKLMDANGNVLKDEVPVQFSFIAAPDDNLGNGATGQIQQDGRFVAEAPGLYTVLAMTGSASTRKIVKARKRFEKQKKIRVVGRGLVNDSHTSDIWVWEGTDGRDYAVTGTWGSNGSAHFWDVTDPTDIQRISTVTVDARTVNDVKVSPNGKICVISREGASNRKNGIVIYNVEDPKNPVQLTAFDDELTGGVHNVFVEDDYIYALSASRRYDIIDIKDPNKPKKISSYQIFQPGASIHDVWVKDGIAYSSNWRYGVHMVDVGYGIAGGSPENPKFISSYAYPNGWNHAAFPYRSPQSGKSYVIAGDEAFPFGLSTKGKPTYPRGWFHFIDFSDLKNPKEVARYEVPEAGTHNMWVEDDIMYAAYYNGGLRVVDISGDLMGDLYKQGREMAFFLPTDEKGYIPNAPMVWGPQPHKGHIFFSDWNTGLWAVKMSD
jgi:hypothetical protein